MRFATIGPSLTQMGTTGKHAQGVIDTFINEDPNPIPLAAPLFLAGNGTDDGLAVVLPSSIFPVNSGNIAIFAGIAAYSAAQNQPIDCVVRNLHTAARITLQTRSASSAGFASWSGVSAGDVFQAESVNNGLVRTSAGGQNNYGPLIHALFYAASGTTQASNFASGSATVAYTAYTTQSGTNSTAATTTALTATYTLYTNASAVYTTGKVFVRSM